MVWAQVDLLRATKTKGCRYSTCWTHTEFSILVDNLAYDKVVGVRWENADTVGWQEAQAWYELTTAEGRELWDLFLANDVLQFSVIYNAGGQTFTRGPYELTGGRPDFESDTGTWLNDSVNVLVWNVGSLWSGSSTVNISVNVRNIAPEKRVQVVYTTDDWNTMQYADLSYPGERVFHGYGIIPNPSIYSTEIWQGSFPVGNADRVEYAIVYEAEGATYWDNNFGDNYVLERRQPH